MAVFDMLPSDDVRTWLFRIVHLGVWGVLIALAFFVLLLLQNFYLMHSLRKLRFEMRSLNMRLNRLLGTTLNASGGKSVV